MGAIGTAALDFTSTPSDSTSVAVTGQATIASDSTCEAFFMRDTTADNGGDEHEEAATMVPLVCGDVIAGTGFTIFANTIGALVTGQFKVHWVWS